MKFAHLCAFAMLSTGSALITPAMATQVLTLTGDPWPPYVTGKLGEDASGGIGVAIIREIFRHVDGVQVRFPLQPWKRALRDVETGGSDGIALLLKTPEREAYMAFSQPVIASRSLVWYRADRFPAGYRWQSVQELFEKHIGVIGGYSYGTEIDRAIAEGRVRATKVGAIRQLFQMLARDRVDLVLANDAVGYAMAKSFTGQTRIVAAQAATGTDVYHIGFSRRSGASRWVARVDEVIGRLRAEGVIDRLLQDYYAQD